MIGFFLNTRPSGSTVRFQSGRFNLAPSLAPEVGPAGVGGIAREEIVRTRCTFHELLR